MEKTINLIVLVHQKAVHIKWLEISKQTTLTIVHWKKSKWLLLVFTEI